MEDGTHIQSRRMKALEMTSLKKSSHRFRENIDRIKQNKRVLENGEDRND